MTVQGKSAIDTLLAESFKELAMQRSIEKITIKEITDKAGLSAPPFIIIFRINMSFWNGLSQTTFCGPSSPWWKTV